MIRTVLSLLAFFSVFIGSGQTISDYQSAQLKHYKVVGFGEACHGSYSDYVARAELIKCLIKNGDSISVLIEMPHATGIAIAKYYNDEIDADSLINEAKYYGLQTNAFLDFINQFKGNRLVTFHGIDMQSQQSTLLYLEETLRVIQPELASELAPVIDSLNHNFTFDYSDSMYLAILPVIERNMNDLKSTLESHGLLKPTYYLSLQYPLTIVEQYFRMLDYVKRDMYFEYGLYRDSCMANNTIALSNFTGKQSVVLAANGHVMANNKSKYPMMGGHVKNQFKDDYFVIASQYYEGALLEVDVINGERVILKKKLDPPIKKALPYKLFTQLKPQNDSLIFVSSGNNKIDRLFSKKAFGQDMGTGRGGSDYKRIGLVFFKPGEYDAVYFIRNVQASVNLVP